jgi:hypothetical protein
MATLESSKILEISKDYQEKIEPGDTFPCVKSNVVDAITALDLWLSNNQAAINSAIPLPARTALSTRQKARMLVYVLQKRFNLGL